MRAIAVLLAATLYGCAGSQPIGQAVGSPSLALSQTSGHECLPGVREHFRSSYNEASARVGHVFWIDRIGIVSCSELDRSMLAVIGLSGRDCSWRREGKLEVLGIERSIGVAACNDGATYFSVQWSNGNISYVKISEQSRFLTEDPEGKKAHEEQQRKTAAEAKLRKNSQN